MRPVDAPLAAARGDGAAATPPTPVAIEHVTPCVPDGPWDAKTVIGDDVHVEADLFAHGHAAVSGALRVRPAGTEHWTDVPMHEIGNDRFRASFRPSTAGRWEFTLVAWVDELESWRRDLDRWTEARHVDPAALEQGARLAEEAAHRAETGVERGGSGSGNGDARADGGRLRAWADRLRRGEAPSSDGLDRLVALARRHPDRTHACELGTILGVFASPELAAFSAWYEMFPRSASPDPTRPGTLRDVEARLPYVAELGFDVLYLPPIHPIGRTNRRGPDDTPGAAPDDPGCPWAIGGPAGGHDAIDPGLGDVDDFAALVRAARRTGIEIALDYALQCSPNHPWVAEHPEWFRHAPDGTIPHAENPPKRYEDIYPLDFDCDDWQGLWIACRAVLETWIERGVRAFRVDNPHTKPFPFWEWLLRTVKERHPETVFLAEAFTRPKVMQRLAKLGFDQSYTYFTWRTTKHELEEYGRELSRAPERFWFRPNLWPNTPDILSEDLQSGGRGAFVGRLVLAAFLAGSYGIYGPPFELAEHRSREPGSEEYLGAEKYEVRHWDLDRPGTLRHVIARVNRIRHAHPALRRDHLLAFHRVDNEALVTWSKRTSDRRDVVLCIVNVDWHHVQSGWTDLDLDELGLTAEEPYEVHDLLTDARYQWRGAHGYVVLDPAVVPAHVFALHRQGGPS